MTVPERVAVIADHLFQLTGDVPINVEFVAKKRPCQVKIIIEVTRERLNEIITAADDL